MKRWAFNFIPGASLFFPAVLIVLVSTAVYLSALSNGFILDDYSQVVKNSFIRDVRRLPEVFLRNAWTFEGAPPISNYYRPMLNLLYMAGYGISGLHAWGYHLINILFHAGASVLVFLIAARLLGVPFHDSRFAIGPSGLPPFVAAMLFAVHPIHTEAVSWIAGLPDVSFAFFYLLSFYLYIRSGGNHAWDYAASVSCFLLSVLCKEPGLTLPAILLAYDYAFEKRKIVPLRSVKRYAPYVFAAAGYFGIRFFVLGGFAPLRKLGGLSTFEYAINSFPAFTKYIYKLFLPVNLNFWIVYEPVKTLFSAEWIFSFCLTLIFTGCLIISARKNKMVFISLLLIALPLVPALYLKGIIGKLFSERYLYLPSAGFAMLFASTLCKFDKSPVKRWFVPVLMLLMVVYSSATIARNSVWKDEYSLFSDTVHKSPDSAVPHLELGSAFLLRGQPDKAIEHLLTAMRLEPRLYVIHHHLGLALAGRNRFYEALEQYQVAIMLNPNRPEIHEDLGRALASSGFGDLAVGEFEAAAALEPSASRFNMLGVAYARRGQLEKAMEKFRIAVSLDPGHASSTRNLAEALEQKNSLVGKGKETDHRWEFDERSLTAAEMFGFAW